MEHSLRTVHLSTSRTPAFIPLVALLLAISGVMGLVSASTGIKTYRSDLRRTVITHYASGTLRIVSIVIVLVWGRWWYAQRAHFHD